MSATISGINSAQMDVESPLVSTSNQKTLQMSATTSGDTVKISEAAQVTQLSRQGESSSQIAKNLGIDVATVNLYLGVVAQAALESTVTAVSASSATTATSAASSSAAVTPSKTTSTTAT
jgi:hypothetical protein